MSKWVKLDDNNIIIASYIVESHQAIDKKINDSFNLNEIIGKKWVDENTIIAPLSIEEQEKRWRDQELSTTDWIVSVTDHPQYEAYMAYRQALRDWPNTADFPDTKPQLGA